MATIDPQLLAGGTSALGFAGGIAQGGTQGDVKAGASGAKLAGQLTGNPELSSFGQGVGAGLNIYEGLKQGGATGYGAAAVGTAQLGAEAGAFGAESAAVGEIAGYAAIPLAIANEVKGWQSGATTSDALAGASSGAAVGTAIMPGVGTAIGAVAGAALGALSSVFGGGRVDPENVPFEKYTQAFNKLNGHPQAQQQLAGMIQDPYLALAGMFDLRSNQIKGTIPMYAKYGRMGEQKFTNDMVAQINQAAQKGLISRASTPQQVMQHVVQPWLNSMGAWNDSNKGAMTALMQQMVAQYMNGSAQSQWKGRSGDKAFANLPAFGAQGFNTQPTAAKQQLQTTVAHAVMSFPGGGPGVQSSSSSSMLPLLIAGIAGVGVGAMAAGSSSPTAADTAGGTSGGDGSFLSSMGSGISNFLSSPVGNIAEFGALAGLGEVQASQQKSENQAQAGSIAKQGQPYSASGAAELSQLTTGKNMGGPLGDSINQQTTAAKELGAVADQYGTGQLTSAQQQQVSDYVKQQRAMVDSQLAASGNTDGSARQAAYQQIDNNAAQLTQQLTQGNIQTATAALTTVQQTYNGLLNQALTQSEFGLGAQEQAVSLLIQGDTQLSQSLNQLFAGIAQGFGTAMGGGNQSKSQGGGAGSAVSNAIGAIGRAVGGMGKGGVASSAEGGGANLDLQGSTADQLSADTSLQEMSTNTDIQTANDQAMFTPDLSGINAPQYDFGGDPFGGP